MYEASIAITSDTSSAVTEDFLADNLIENLEYRSGGNDLLAIKSHNPLDYLGQHTCFKTNYATIRAQNNKMIIGFNFGESVFIHAVMHAQDNLDGVGAWN